MGYLSRLLKKLDGFYFSIWHAQENYGSDDDRFWLPYKAWQAVLEFQYLLRRQR